MTGWNQIVAHIPRLRRYARALVGERAGADDLVQDTLERAMNKFHLWTQGSDLRAWLFSIMHNVHVNQVRSARAQREEALDEAVHDLAVAPGQADRVQMLDLEAALRLLPDEQREVLLLVALEQMSYGEAARALGIPAGTVMSRLSRARERLRALTSGAQPAASNLRIVK